MRKRSLGSLEMKKGAGIINWPDPPETQGSAGINIRHGNIRCGNIFVRCGNSANPADIFKGPAPYFRERPIPTFGVRGFMGGEVRTKVAKNSAFSSKPQEKYI